jgi:hypothetical protein
LQYKVEEADMNERAGTTGGAGMDDAAGMADGTPMGVAEAAAIIRDAGEKARRGLGVRHRATFTIWGLGLLIGYGAIWLTVRGQHPFRGPDPVAFAAVALLGAASIMAGLDQARAESGVRGLSAVRRRLSFASVLLGLAAMFAVEGALVHAGAGRPVTSVFEASAPVLVAGLFYLTSSAVRPRWAVTGLGLWLLVVAAAGGFAGPAGVWGVDALAAGLAYLLMAAIQPRLRRP